MRLYAMRGERGAFVYAIRMQKTLKESTNFEPTNTMISGIHHVNLIVQPGTLHLARDPYGDTLGLTSRPVPQVQGETLAWFDISTLG
jgi:hypothetical protein